MPRAGRSKEITRRISAVSRAMREAWNPIGIDELPADEYEAYAPVVVGMFERGASDEEVALHLSQIEDRSMELQPATLEALIEVARVLRAAT